jgi:alpha-beta hydrolase superfamily lysophospholipase
MRSAFERLVGRGARSSAAPDEEPFAPGERRRTVATRSGVQLPFLWVEAQAPLRGLVVALPGGDGRLELSETGIGRETSNFVVRTRHRLARAGYRVAVVDVPSDHQRSGIDHYRVSRKQSRDLGALIDRLARESPRLPVFLVGISRGTISAATAAAELPEGKIDGLILASSVTEGDRLTLDDVAVERIRPPTLLLHELGDRCRSSPSSGAERLQDRFERARLVELELLDRAIPRPGASPCGGRSAHGFEGESGRAIARIVEFMRSVRD